MQVKSGITSFTRSSFKTDVGDPMYDSILALNAKMATNGTTLKTVAARIATGAQACLTEKIQISIGGQQKKFCPISKSDVPEEADTSILDYKFIDVANAVLLVKVRENTVLSVDFTTGAGVTYSCVGAACAGVSTRCGGRGPAVVRSCSKSGAHGEWERGAARWHVHRAAAFDRVAGPAVFR